MDEYQEKLMAQINELKTKIAVAEKDLEGKRQFLYQLQGGLQATEGLLNVYNEFNKNQSK